MNRRMDKQTNRQTDERTNGLTFVIVESLLRLKIRGMSNVNTCSVMCLFHNHSVHNIQGSILRLQKLPIIKILLLWTLAFQSKKQLRNLFCSCGFVKQDVDLLLTKTFRCRYVSKFVHHQTSFNHENPL